MLVAMESVSTGVLLFACGGGWWLRVASESLRVMPPGGRGC